MRMTKTYAKEILELNRPSCSLNGISYGALSTKLEIGRNDILGGITTQDINVIHAALVLAGVTKE